MIRIAELPDMVIRPSGVWDSRAPFHNYLSEHHRIEQVYAVSTLASLRAKHDIQYVLPETTVKQFFGVKHGGQRNKVAWQMLRDATPGDLSMRQLQDLFELTTIEATEHGVVRFVASFDTYLQCWALNYLITLLENGVPWSPAERRLARRFWPVPHAPALANVPQIVAAIPALHEWLSGLPHVNTNRNSGEAVSVPVTSNLNALAVLLFWRAFRNLAIHRGGIVSLQFVARHNTLYEDMRKDFPHLRPLQVGRRVSVVPGLFVAVATTQYKAARFLSVELEKMSAGRRGHPFAPGAIPDGVVFTGSPPPSPKFLLAGDHDLSLRWVDDAAFRVSVHSEVRHAPKREAEDERGLTRR